MEPQEYVKKKRLKAVPAVYLLLILSGEILLMLRKNTGYQDGNWDLPAGHMEDGELPTGALIREVREEIGVTLTERNLTLVHTSYRPEHDPTGNRIDLFFVAGTCVGTPVNAEPHKCERLDWFRPEILPSNITPHSRNAVEAYLRRSRYSELGLDWIKSQSLYKL